MCDDHPWTLTAPWWGWPKLDVPGRDPRATAPLLQMYDRSDPVSGFVKEPQKRLAWGADDVVQQLVITCPPGKKPRLADHCLVPTGVRKLFLPVHKRFYLVVCELHCQMRGLPSVGRGQVCEAGFVVRRRRLRFAPQHADTARELVAKIGSLAAQLALGERAGPRRLLRKRVRVTGGGVFGAAAGPAEPPAGVAALVDAKARERRAALEAELTAARAQLLRWKADAGAVSVAEGWIPDADAENVGAWAAVDDRPQALEEVVYPLSPLVADPRDPRHDAAGKTLWFGVLPAGSREADAGGAARFDDATRYEVRCFVRRHRCGCPRTGERGDCGGELVWSEPTPVFQLASHFDPVGTGNHPVTIQMPDIPALAATVGARLPVQLHFPQGSGLNVSADADGKPKKLGVNTAGVQICFFSIPLITIVATFVLNLFLPIVVFLFGLWFLLGLKFCIPPSLSLSGGAALHATLEASIDLAVRGRLEADIDADATLTGDLGADFNLLTLGDPGSVGGGGAHRTPQANTPGALFTKGRGNPGDPDYAPPHANAAVNELRAGMAKDRSAEGAGADLTAGLRWAPRVERREVGA